MIETAGGQYLNAVSAAQGRIKSFTATVELSSKGIYTKGPKSLTLQMMELFDPITGKTGKDFGKSSSRTFVKDFLDSLIDSTLSNLLSIFIFSVFVVECSVNSLVAKPNFELNTATSFNFVS